MKKVLAIGLLVTAAAMVGCGGSGETSNMMEGADKSELQKYEEMIAAETAAMSASPDDEELQEAKTANAPAE